PPPPPPQFSSRRRHTRYSAMSRGLGDFYMRIGLFRYSDICCCVVDLYFLNEAGSILLDKMRAGFERLYRGFGAV
ncbi:hypothetical protein ACVGWX_09365, partial [Enterobacter hormaechei]